MTLKKDIRTLKGKEVKDKKLSKEVKELFARVEDLEEYFLGKNPKKHKDYKHFSKK